MAVDDDPQNGSVYVAPATGSAVDLDGYLLAGRGGWARMLRDRDQLRAVASGPQLQVVAGGGLVRVWQPHRAHRVRYVIDPETGEAAICPQAVKRGAVVGMSFKAQRRMRDLLHSLRSDGPAPLWVTLTLPGAAPGPDRVRVMFNSWVKRVSRKFPGYAGVWRIAPQQRGAAHLHLMMWGVVADGDTFTLGGGEHETFGGFAQATDRERVGDVGELGTEMTLRLGLVRKGTGENSG